MAAVFDTLDFAKRAEAVGFPIPMAEFQAHEMGEMAKRLNDNAASKKDLEELYQRISSELKLLEIRLSSKIDKLLIKVGSVVVAIAGLSVMILELTIKH